MGFRAACAEQARRVGLAGWVANVEDGTVEAAFEGPSRTVEWMVAWCRTGPPAALVVGVRVRTEQAIGERVFRVLHERR